MRLGTCLLFEGRTLQGAHPKLAYFCSAPVEGFYAAVDSSLALVARSFIEALAAEVGEAVRLAQLDKVCVLFVDKCKATAHFETLAQAGKIAPGYCTGVGKAILAFMLRVEQNHALEQQSYVAYTPFTLTSRSALMDPLRIIRTNSLAYDREEHG